MYYLSVKFGKAWKLFDGFSSWQKQVMDQGQNLIDFGESRSELNIVSGTGTAESSENTSASFPADVPAESSESQAVTSSSKATRPNKSLFEITRVEPTHGESVGGDDSELDDTFSETHDSSSTSIVENIKNDDSSEIPGNGIDVIDAKLKPLTVAVESQQPSTGNSTPSSASSTPPVSAVTSTTTEPPSRFRIVKIIKAKPYEKGKWSISDFQDSQKQTESSDVPASPGIRRSTSATHKKRSSSGEQKFTESSKSITSPSGATELVKSTSQEIFTSANSRGSSYNTVIGERKNSQDRTNAPGESNASGATVTPMVEALESALDQIHSIKESMLFAFKDEMKKLRETIAYLQAENSQLKEENELLKNKLELAESKLLSIDQG